MPKPSNILEVLICDSLTHNFFIFIHLGWREKSLSNFWKNIFSLMVSSYFYSRHSPSLNLKLSSLRRCCILLSLSLIILSSSLKLHHAAFIRNSVRNWSKGLHTCTPEFVWFCNLISTRITILFYFIKHISMLFYLHSPYTQNTILRCLSPPQLIIVAVWISLCKSSNR